LELLRSLSFGLWYRDHRKSIIIRIQTVRKFVIGQFFRTLIFIKFIFLRGERDGSQLLPRIHVVNSKSPAAAKMTFMAILADAFLSAFLSRLTHLPVIM
jgi:hypothetical protein